MASLNNKICKSHPTPLHMNDNHARLSPALVETIAGLSAGTVSTLAVHPLDVVKTRLQIHRNESKTPTSGLAIFRSLLKNPRPIPTLYRGLTPNLIGNASTWAMFFYFKSLAEKQILALHNRPVFSSYPSSKRDALSPADYFLASGISGAIITFTANPIWVLKTRMLSSDKGSKGAYTSMWAGCKQILRKEGWRGFYKGTAISLVGVGHGAVQFAVYEPLKRTWRRYVEPQGENTDEKKLSNAGTLITSSTAKGVAGVVTYPYQVVRSRLQTYDAEERFGKGIRGVARKVWEEQGWRGFYRGLGTNVVRVLPATWVTFLVYENMRFYLPAWTEGRAM